MRQSRFERLWVGLAAARARLLGGLADFGREQQTNAAEALEALEAALLAADIGPATTQALLEKAAAPGAQSPEETYRLVRQALLEIVRVCAQPLHLPGSSRPFVILAVGVNGVGKTTTIAKIARRLTIENHRVLLAAADTYRAAAVEQLAAWAGRLGVELIAQGSGADAAAVAHDAYRAAQARNADVLIIDTAGRQHTHGGLMDELKKIRRVLTRLAPDAPHEVLLVLDANTGQNAIAQVQSFREAVGVTGLGITKLDGTAKAGVLVAITRATRLPIRFIGVGEAIDDLLPFSAEDYVEALLPATARGP